MKVGIVGNGMIVPIAIEAMLRAEIEVTSLWCRNGSKGKPIVEKYHIQNQYTDYQVFLGDDSFDTVYIGLTNTLHYQYAKDAILAGKHVIVEKPFTVSVTEAKELQALALKYGCMLFEAILSRYSQNYEHLREELPKIGNIKLIQANFSKYSSRYDKFRKGIMTPTFDKACGGGALMDLNVYNIHFVVGLFGMPKKVQYYPNLAENSVDTSGILIMVYPNFQAVCTAAKDSSSDPFVIIQGEEGTIVYPERPGYVRYGERHDRLTNLTEEIDVVAEEDPMKNEFLYMQEIIDTKNTEQMNAWLEKSIATVAVLEQALQSISQG
ncbi:Gfo/Idh/MocA family protein [Solobacterium moorei]